MLIGVSDVFVAGKHSTQYLAAVGIATGMMAPVFVVGLGFLLGLSPVISKRRGEGEETKKYLFTSLCYSLLISLIFIILSLMTSLLAPHLGFEKELVPLIQNYILLFSFSLAPAYFFQAIREFLQGHEDVLVANIVSILTVALNLLFCFALVFGFESVTGMGIKGLALGTIFARSVAALILFLYAFRFFRWGKMDFTFLREVLLLSWPIALGILVEVAAFSFSTVIIGRMGIDQAAAHNIVLNLCSVTYMVPLAVSTAIGVKIAYAYGQKNWHDIVRFTRAGYVLSVSFMLMTGLSFYFFPQIFSSIFTQSSEVSALVALLLVPVAIFQIFDGTQVCLGGALRGVNKTQPQAYVMFLSYWALGLPLGLFLATREKLQALGLWIGFAGALFLAAISMVIILLSIYKKIKKEILIKESA